MQQRILPIYLPFLPTQRAVAVQTRALLAHRQQTLLDGVPLGLGERAALGEAVDGVKGGVDERGVVLGAGEERRAAGEEGQQGGADVAVHGQRRLRGAETLLWKVDDAGWTSCLFLGS